MGLFTKKTASAIDPEQLELIENAQSRLRKKKKLYRHFVFFLAGAVIIILLNLVLGVGKDFKILDIDWFVWAILAWGFFFLVHLINVFLLGSFMNKAWEEQQMQRLIIKQKERIAALEDEVATTHPLPEKKNLNLNSNNDQNTPL